MLTLVGVQEGSEYIRISVRPWVACPVFLTNLGQFGCDGLIIFLPLLTQLSFENVVLSVMNQWFGGECRVTELAGAQ